MRLSSLLILFFLLFGTAVIGGRSAQKPPEPAPQPKECVTVNVASPQADSKTSTADAIAVAHTVAVTAEVAIAFVGVIAAILAIILGFAGVGNWKESQKLAEARSEIDVKFIGIRQEQDNISKDMEKITERENYLRQSSETVLKEVAELREQEKSLRELTDTVLREVEELREQEFSLRKLTETVRTVVLARSGLGTETRLTALQRLSQQVDPLGIPALLEVVTGSKNDTKLRLEAAYGLGRYSENPAFREYYPEIISGFREVLSDLNTPKALVTDMIKRARLFGTDSNELIPLFERWEQSDAHAGPSVS